MKIEIKCPVCGKTGIEDYHSKDIVCPCCGSDLSVFRAIDEIAEKKRHSRLWIPMIAIIGIIATYCCINILHSQKEINSLGNKIVQLKDSISRLNTPISEPAPPPIKHHIVQKGDNLWKISHQYYNTGTHYRDIAQWNNIEIHTTLHIGDTIILK